MKNILKSISESSTHMSPVYRQLGQFILEHYGSVTEMDISTLANAANVSTATVTRFAISLGCSGFPELRQQLQKIRFNNYSSLEEINDVLRRHPASDVKDVDEALRGLCGRYRLIDKELLHKAAEMICASDRVLIAGNQISAMFVPYTIYLLGKYRDNLIDISAMSFEDEKLLENAEGKNCALIFALQRYPNTTIKAIRRLYECGIPMIIISDSDLFPFEDMAKVMLHVGFKNSLAFEPIMLVYSVIYEIILKVVMMDAGTAERNVKRFDEFVERNDVFYGGAGE